MTAFGDAFKAARKAGKTTFKFNGKSYHTKTKDDVAKAPKPAAKPTTTASAPTPKPSPKPTVISDYGANAGKTRVVDAPSRAPVAPTPTKKPTVIADYGANAGKTRVLDDSETASPKKKKPTLSIPTMRASSGGGGW